MHNAFVALGKMATMHSLQEVLGIDRVRPAGALQGALALGDEVRSGRLSGQNYR